MSTLRWLTCVICIHWLMTLSFYIPLFCMVSWLCLSDIILIMNGKGPAVNSLKTISISTLSWLCVFVVTCCSMVDDFDSWPLHNVYVCKSLAYFKVRRHRIASPSCCRISNPIADVVQWTVSCLLGNRSQHWQTLILDSNQVSQVFKRLI